ncbi:hypothetical protein EYF80_039471 [Liparis tanakae]|uniref:Uncharacterized protein n=1 Tax=Liparis tanakae TaxID=230148 RepID=A0A4Z2GBQ7_9TELE|nr:hypothetical protein EYF80_039471 [Liparis tanakae]
MLWQAWPSCRYTLAGQCGSAPVQNSGRSQELLVSRHMVPASLSCGHVQHRELGRTRDLQHHDFQVKGVDFLSGGFAPILP